MSSASNSTSPPLDHDSVPPESYKIHIPSRYLNLTIQKFDNARLPRETVTAAGTANGTEQNEEPEDWGEGLPRKFLEGLIDFWQEEYNWRQQEAALNELPHFRVPLAVHGSVLRMHFLWHRGRRKDDSGALVEVNGAGTSDIPPVDGAATASNSNSHPVKKARRVVVLVGEVWEFMKLFQRLQVPTGDAGDLEIVLPSIPGTGHSDSPPDFRGFGAKKAAECVHALMTKLGYDRYVVYGSGPMSFTICRQLSFLYPKAIQGIHVTTAPFKAPPVRHSKLKQFLLKLLPGSSHNEPASVTAAQRAAENEIARYRAFDAEGPGAASKLMNYALTDSPVALLAWVVERLRAEGPMYPWTKHEFMTILMVHWAPGIQGLLRLYQETAKAGEMEDTMSKGSSVPLGITALPGRAPPKEYIQLLMPNTTFYRARSEGGRLLAFEHPEIAKEDLEGFIATLPE